MSEILTPDDIKAMRKYLTDFPPRLGPPPALEFFDVERIVATLEHYEAERGRESARSEDVRIDLRDPLEVQRAHDILHAVAAGEIDLHFSELYLKHCHTAHDVLAWVLGFECQEIEGGGCG